MGVNVTSVPKGLINMTRAPVTAARKGIRITMMVNATSVPKGIIHMARVPVSAVGRGIRITMGVVAGTSQVVLEHRVP